MVSTSCSAALVVVALTQAATTAETAIQLSWNEQRTFINPTGEIAARADLKRRIVYASSDPPRFGLEGDEPIVDDEGVWNIYRGERWIDEKIERRLLPQQPEDESISGLWEIREIQPDSALKIVFSDVPAFLIAAPRDYLSARFADLDEWRSESHEGDLRALIYRQVEFHPDPLFGEWETEVWFAGDRVVRYEERRGGQTATLIEFDWPEDGGATHPVGWRASAFSPKETGAELREQVDAVVTAFETDAPIDAATFAPAFPPGAVVDDRRTNDRYRIGPTGRRLPVGTTAPPAPRVIPTWPTILLSLVAAFVAGAFFVIRRSRS